MTREQGVGHLDYEDAHTESVLYAEWLIRTSTTGRLADRVGRLLRHGGYSVTDSLLAGLDRLDPVDLADFLAANSPFETDDVRWLDYCRQRYPTIPHPSETFAQRNGGRVSWRD